jgi:hypothetical protein
MGKYIISQHGQFIGDYPAADEISYLAPLLVLSIFTHHETKESLNGR